MTTALELGLDTFGDVTVDDAGVPLHEGRVLRDVVEQAVAADALGVDFIGLGEHHRADFAISAPEIVLAHIAAKTMRIKLGTSVTVLSSDDPIRVFQRFSTLNALSNGRAEVTLGRGSFTESFPLFGFDLNQYETLFEEKLDLFSVLLASEEVTWQGSLRPPLRNQKVFPRLGPDGLTCWIGVGGSPQSVVRAVHYDMRMMLAIIGGDPARFRPYVDLYHKACAQMGRPVRPLGVHSPGHLAATDEEALDQLWPHYKAFHDRLARERGWSPMDRDGFVAEARHGALYCGSPETVAARIARTARTLGLSRFDLKYATGTMPHARLMASIELYGTRVIPLVREMMEGS
ncbi:LLM class flavin-dependent oxidoreductase [Polymorphum gilvum]|uniref:Oxidoreductase protein n=1 Tax=Polymorphum gilvum (strain LMG 25793 / CGMCC 1.9160 / SL003B-26A1) TaxID=991905 RepID=F2J4D6_POLGS|nr:LLM class flavin-dependent oxidoreductase [Polymorphum gilvum]ADZ71078.1 Oxidoreductase protein [Polymorphum gilvum SL003B-26A1]